jgi:hypothetical protein
MAGGGRENDGDVRDARVMLGEVLDDLTPAQVAVVLVIARILQKTKPDDGSCAEQVVMLGYNFETGVRVGIAGGGPRRGEA